MTNRPDLTARKDGQINKKEEGPDAVGIGFGPNQNKVMTVHELEVALAALPAGMEQSEIQIATGYIPLNLTTIRFEDRRVFIEVALSDEDETEAK